MSSESSEEGTGSGGGCPAEGLECPICWEWFNVVENVPYVLWCGHTLCKNCVLGLRWSVLKLPTVPVQLPLFITCPWCGLLSLRLVFRATLAFPRKNFLLLWMVENMNRQTPKPPSLLAPHPDPPAHTPSPDRPLRTRHPHGRDNRHHPPAGQMADSPFRKIIGFFAHLIAKLPLVGLFLLVVLCVIPASVAVLALYVLATVLFGLPSFLVLYFAYPGLEWLVREIVMGRG